MRGGAVRKSGFEAKEYLDPCFFRYLCLVHHPTASMASSSSSSRRLVSGASQEGLKHLYRTLLHQARLLSATFNDPILYSSHRFLARKNIEPLLTSSPPSVEWPPSTASKRLARARLHRRQLADANHGWEHAVHRALSLAYARSGKLRRDALSDLSPKSAPSEQLDEGGVPRAERVSPVLLAIVTNAATMNGAAVKMAAHMTERPPPPFLPKEDDPLVTMFGRAKRASTLQNAMARYRRTYLRKIKLPIDVVSAETPAPSLFAHLENLARGQSPRVGHRPYLAAARGAVEMYRSDVSGAAHRKRSLRVHGWSSHPKHCTARAQRRLYGRILSDAPLLIIPAANEMDVAKAKNDPLGIRARLRAAHQVAMDEKTPPGKMRAVTSSLAVGASSKGRAESPGQGKQVQHLLAPSEVHFLKQNGLL